MDDSENMQYLNKLAVSLGVSYGRMYLVRQHNLILKYLIYVAINTDLLCTQYRYQISSDERCVQGAYANLDIMQVYILNRLL